MAVEQFTNGPQTTLDGAIDDTVTTLDVTSSALFPSSPNYRIRIDSEIMLVTAGAGTLTWTVTRGVDGTTAASHIDGSAVTHVLTADAVAEYRADNVFAGTYANRPTAGKEGRLYVPTEGNQLVIQRDNGSVWQSFGPYQLNYQAPPAVGGLTWVNQESATAVNDDAGILMSSPSSGSVDRRILYIAPGSTPWGLRIACKGFGYPNGKHGLVLRDGTTGELYGWGPIITQTQPPVLSAKFSSAPTGGSFAPDFQSTWSNGDIVWLGLEYDGTDATCLASDDGEHWYVMHVEDLSALMTATQIGILLEQATGNTLPQYMRVFSWEET